jgi:hypothetical protein
MFSMGCPPSMRCDGWSSRRSSGPNVPQPESGLDEAALGRREGRVQSADKMVLRRKGVKADQFDFILNRMVEQSAALYSEWPMVA